MTFEGKLTAAGRSFGIVVSRFNWFIGEKLLQGAIDCFLRHGGDEKKIDVIKVPGSFEIPLAAQKAAALKRYDAIVCLGAVIRGETPHYEYVAAEAAKGVAAVGLQSGTPTIFGILTTASVEEAIERAGSKGGNKGWDAALSAMEMADLLKNLS
jgi:6,7-dimethyl-8-ribityllumazine synthase